MLEKRYILAILAFFTTFNVYSLRNGITVRLDFHGPVFIDFIPKKYDLDFYRSNGLFSVCLKLLNVIIFFSILKMATIQVGFVIAYDFKVLFLLETFAALTMWHCRTCKTDSTNKTESFEDDTVCPAPEFDPQYVNSSKGTSQSGTEVRSTDIIWNEKDKADILGAYFIGYRYETRISLRIS